MRSGDGRQDAGLGRDLRALRRLLWIPVVTVAVGIGAALLLGAFADGTQEARFRSNVVVNALPPLFGPPVLPGLSTTPLWRRVTPRVEQVAAQHSLSPEELRPRLTAEPRVNTPEIDFTVTGEDALAIAETWNQVFGEEAIAQTPRIQTELTLPYVTQRDEAGTRLNRQPTRLRDSPTMLSPRQDSQRHRRTMRRHRSSISRTTSSAGR